VIRMLPLRTKIECLIGDPRQGVRREPLVPYDERVCEWLDLLSRTLMTDPRAKRYPDVISFAYWCRRSNIKRLRSAFAEDGSVRLGLGMVFHVTPSNVPINFAFSYVLSLLAGNANVVRVPTRAFPQTDIVCSVIRGLLGAVENEWMVGRTVFVRYEQDDEITRELSALCDGRVIWGGDEAVRSIRKFPIPVRGTEVAFADRYSLCVIHPGAVVRSDETQMSRLVESFYNDTFVMDQNACSSPHLVVWLGGTDEEAMLAKERFWSELHVLVGSRYTLQPVSAVDKYTTLCQNSIELEGIAGVHRHENLLYRVAVDSVSKKIEDLRGNCGYFYEYDTEDIESLVPVISGKYQTLTYFGVEKLDLVDFVIGNGLAGIDRIVPVGRALDMDVMWDGYDIVRTLSRVIDVK
jgi:hypothetical protein